MNEVLWRGTSSNRLLAYFIVALAAVLSILVIFTNQYAAPEKQIQGGAWFGFYTVMVILPIVGIVFSRLEVIVRTDGVVVGFGPTGFPKSFIDYNNVVKVTTLYVRPTEWGGWGYRWVPWRKATAAVMHAGEGLKFNFANGKQFVVTVDDTNAAMDAIRKAMDALPPSN